MKKIGVSDIIESKCTRCRRVTNHTIVAMVGSRVVRVQCNTCSGIHNYHPPQAEPVARQPRSSASGGGAAKSSAAKKSMANEETWEKLLSDKDPAKAHPYDPARRFKANELVNHPVFGMGAVSVVRGNKMEVVFRDGMKVLRCG